MIEPSIRQDHKSARAQWMLVCKGCEGTRDARTQGCKGVRVQRVKGARGGRTWV